MTVHPVLYLSGSVTGQPKDNRKRFEAEAQRLRAAGYRVMIPHDDVKPGTPWAAALKLTLTSMMTQADGLALIDGWERSRGATLEARVAKELGMPTMTVDAWIRERDKENKK